MNTASRQRLSLIGGLGASALIVGSVLAPGCGSASGDAPREDAGAEAAANRAMPLDASEAGAAADAGVDAPSFAALVDDPARWKPVPNPGGCNLHEGTVVPDPFPKRTWTSCGPGCLATPAALSFAPGVVVNRLTAASEYVGAVYLNSSFGNKLARVTRLERLPDGPTIAATMTKGEAGTCVLGLVGGAAASMFLMIGTNDDFRYGRAPAAPGGPIAWQADWRTDANGGPQRFVFHDGLGLGRPGGPLLMLDDDPATVIDLPGGADRIVGRGEQLVWAAGYTNAIHAYTKAKGHVELVPLPGRGAIGIGLSDERMVWMSGIRAFEGYADRRWHWSPRATDPADVVAHDGPSLAGQGHLIGDIKTAGDWAATTHCPIPEDLTSCKLIAWNIATNQSYAVSGRAGSVFWNVLAVTPTELYLAEVDIATGGLGLLDNVVRIEISALPALAASGWPH